MTKILNEKNIDFIVEELKNKKTFALMTDTVAGVICSFNEEDAIKKIYKLKKRDIKKPIGIFPKGKTIHEIINYIDDITIIDDKIKNDILDIYKYWPGALTIIYKLKNKINYLYNSKETLGIRVPNDFFLLKLLSKVDFNIAQTSLNLSTEEPCKNIEEIIDKFGKKVDYIIKTNNKNIGLSSTIVDATGDRIKIIRQGSVII